VCECVTLHGEKACPTASTEALFTDHYISERESIRPKRRNTDAKERLMCRSPARPLLPYYRIQLLCIYYSYYPDYSCYPCYYPILLSPVKFLRALMTVVNLTRFRRWVTTDNLEWIQTAKQLTHINQTGHEIGKKIQRRRHATNSTYVY
jgi:hypothetical protein